MCFYQTIALQQNIFVYLYTVSIKNITGIFFVLQSSNISKLTHPLYLLRMCGLFTFPGIQLHVRDTTAEADTTVIPCHGDDQETMGGTKRFSRAENSSRLLLCFGNQIIGKKNGHQRKLCTDMYPRKVSIFDKLVNCINLLTDVNLVCKMTIFFPRDKTSRWQSL